MTTPQQAQRGAGGRTGRLWHDATMIAPRPTFRSTTRRARTAGAALALAALGTACTHTATPAAAHVAVTAGPGQVEVTAPGVDLTITQAVAHLDPAGSGTLTMTVHNGSNIPEHLGMVATPKGDRGVLAGSSKNTGNGSMTSAGILLQPGSTVTFGGSGPTVRLTQVHGVTTAHALPLMLQFGVARLIRLSAVVSGS
jgi:copper(I)-binding protein